LKCHGSCLLVLQSPHSDAQMLSWTDRIHLHARCVPVSCGDLFPVSRSIPSLSVASVSLLGDRSRRDERSLLGDLERRDGELRSRRGGESRR
ncbi:hypothetical protein PENTCL1PPCAC_9102, partial [Pristionchus entomophagus]